MRGGNGEEEKRREETRGGEGTGRKRRGEKRGKKRQVKHKEERRRDGTEGNKEKNRNVRTKRYLVYKMRCGRDVNNRPFILKSKR